jgi:hypothetical protein
MKLKSGDESRSLHCAAGARPDEACGAQELRVRERKKEPAAPVGPAESSGMPKTRMTGLHLGALEKK